MGSMAEWHCKDCGAGESFYCGSGMGGFNNPAVVEQAKDGTFGPAMKRLLGDGIPDGWFVFTENVFYRCLTCNDITNGSALRIDDGSGGWLTYYIQPDDCETCEELGDLELMSEDELFDRCKKYSDDGCPKCGGKHVALNFGCWD